MSKLTMSNKIAIVGIVVAIAAILVPISWSTYTKSKDESIKQKSIDSQQGITADKQSIVISNNSGKIVIKSNDNGKGNK